LEIERENIVLIEIKARKSDCTIDQMKEDSRRQKLHRNKTCTHKIDIKILYMSELHLRHMEDRENVFVNLCCHMLSLDSILSKDTYIYLTLLL